MLSEYDLRESRRNPFVSRYAAATVAMIPQNRKRVQPRDEGHWAIRVSHRAAKGIRDPRFLIRCGCCDNGFEIYYDPRRGEDLEIAGVMGSVQNWREILLPLLGIQPRRAKQPK